MPVNASLLSLFPRVFLSRLSLHFERLDMLLLLLLALSSAPLVATQEDVALDSATWRVLFRAASQRLATAEEEARKATESLLMNQVDAAVINYKLLTYSFITNFHRGNDLYV